MGDDLATLPTDPLTHRRRTLELVAAEMDGAPAAPPEDQLVHALIEARSVAFHLRRISPDLVPQHRARALGLADAITTGIRRYFRELDL